MFSARTQRELSPSLELKGEKHSRETYLLRKEGCSGNRGWGPLEPMLKWRLAVLGTHLDGEKWFPEKLLVLFLNQHTEFRFHSEKKSLCFRRRMRKKYKRD